jgi:hypothetical protein
MSLSSRVNTFVRYVQRLLRVALAQTLRISRSLARQYAHYGL